MSYFAPLSSYHGVLVKLSLFDKWCLYLTPSFRVNSWIQDCEIWPRKIRNITLSCGALSSLGVDHQRVRQIDRWTKLRQPQRAR